jgi:hypothetical protein
VVARELLNVLAPAYTCDSFTTDCKSMRNEPQAGLFPRGYTGAAGLLADVDLAVVIAEPGEPPGDAKPQPAGEPGAIIESIAASVGDTLRTARSAFHRNVSFLLACCWPELSFDERLKRTWITEGVLCSAAKTTGTVPRIVETTCAERYLAKQLALLPNAFVIAMGVKARRRLNLAGRPADVTVRAAGLPGGNSKAAKPSWQAAGLAFRDHLRHVGKL